MAAPAAAEGPPQPLSADLADLQQCLVLGQITQEEHDDLRRQALEGFARKLQRRSSSPVAGDEDKAPPDASSVVPPLGGTLAAAQSCCPAPEAPSAQEPRGEAADAREGDVHCQLSARGLRRRGQDSVEGSQADQESEPDFWCKWIQRRIIPSKSQNNLNKATVHDIIDVTAGRLDEVFSRFDTNRDGELNHDELAAALNSQGFDIDASGAAELSSHVWEMSGRTPRDVVTVREFDTMTTRLRLAELFTPFAGLFQWTQYDGPTTSPVSCCDYNHIFCQIHHNVGERADFFFGCRRPLAQPQATNDSAPGGGRVVRWVHMDAFRGIDRLRLLRLAVKYHLHPVHIDDVIENRCSSKFECLADVYAVSVDILSLAEEGISEHGRVRIHRSHVSIFLSGSKDWDTLLTIYQDRPDESSWLAMWRRGTRRPPAKPTNNLWAALQRDLQQQPPRRMREEGADFLLYEVLSHIVEDLRPIADAYAQRLGVMYQGSSGGLTQAWLNELGEVELEITDLSRSIRPMRQLVRHLIGDQRIRSNTRIHLEDVEDAVVEMMEDLSQLQQMARYLQEASERKQDKKMNDTLFVLSLISAIFLPAQFITGLYGMNFVDLNGKPTIPELTWENGYLWFWLWQGVALFTAVVVVYLVSIGCRPCHRLCALLSRCCGSCGSRRTRVHSIDNDRPAEGSLVLEGMAVEPEKS